jgi:hypothetical protein
VTPTSTLALMLALAAPPTPGEAEMAALAAFVETTCAPVRDAPQMFPFRAFPLGPLSVEVRKAASAAEARERRDAHLDVVAGACGLEPGEVTTPFQCGASCVAGRRAHLVSQLAAIRTVAEGFRRTKLQRIAVWAPRGELRVDDVFVMDGKAHEAVPSPTLGLVPSGVWKELPSLAAWLDARDVEESTVRELADGMRGLGVSSVTREGGRLRVVGVGIGDNESGLLLGDGAPPAAGSVAADGRRYETVERVAPDAVFYETN